MGVPVAGKAVVPAGHAAGVPVGATTVGVQGVVVVAGVAGAENTGQIGLATPAQSTVPPVPAATPPQVLDVGLTAEPVVASWMDIWTL